MKAKIKIIIVRVMFFTLFLGCLCSSANAQIEKPVVPAAEKPVVPTVDKPPPAVNPKPADNPKPAGKPILLMDYLTVFHTDVGKFNYSEAEEMCENLNDANSYGYNDWRLPTLTELKMVRSNIKGLTGSYGSQDGILNFSNGTVDSDYGWQNKNFSLRPVRADKPKSVSINLGVTPEYISFSAVNSRRTIYVTTNASTWDISNVPDWCTVSKATATFSISCNDNKNTIKREGTLKIAAGDKVVTIPVSQAAADVTLNATPENLTFSAAGGTSQITVNTNASTWSVLLLPTWCTVSNKYSSSFSVTCAANTGEAHNDYFKVKADDKEVRINVSQEAVEVKEEAEEDIPFAVVEEKPKFQGGDQNTFSKWVNTKINYPSSASDNGIQGRVMLQFTIDKDGNVKNVIVLKKVDPALDKEAVRVVSMSPKWTPGKQRTKAIGVTFQFPVVFQLQ
jgi:TonB family protein